MSTTPDTEEQNMEMTGSILHHARVTAPSVPSTPDSPMETVSAECNSTRSGPIQRPSLRSALLAFSSHWFLVPQGSGITAVILHQLKFQFSGLQVISYILWAFTIISLTVFLFTYAVRTVLFPTR